MGESQLFAFARDAMVERDGTKEPIAAGVVVAWPVTGPQRKVNAPLSMHCTVRSVSLCSLRRKVDTASFEEARATNAKLQFEKAMHCGTAAIAFD
jgi:hypothetical protein